MKAIETFNLYNTDFGLGFSYALSPEKTVICLLPEFNPSYPFLNNVDKILAHTICAGTSSKGKCSFMDLHEVEKAESKIFRYRTVVKCSDCGGLGCHVCLYKGTVKGELDEETTGQLNLFKILGIYVSYRDLKHVFNAAKEQEGANTQFSIEQHNNTFNSKLSSVLMFGVNNCTFIIQGQTKPPENGYIIEL